MEITGLLVVVVVVLVIVILVLANKLGRASQEQAQIARKEAQVQLAEWKAQAEKELRADAIKKSHAVITGKVTEQLVPYLPGFLYNPRDARFLGSPIDLVVFDGLNEGEVRSIVFMEVKTGKSASLTTRERWVRDAIRAGRVEWVKLKAGCDEGIDGEEQR